MRNIKKLFFGILSTVLTAGPFLAYAQDSTEESTKLENPITSVNFQEFLNRVLDILIVFAAPIYGIMIAIAGFTFVTGAGAPEKRSKAMNIFKYSTIGFVIILLGKAIVALVTSLL